MTFTKKTKGFTLIESMIVVTIIMVTASIGYPNFIRTFKSNNIENEAKEFALNINTIRKEAIERDVPIFIYSSDLGKWNTTWTKYVDENTVNYTIKNDVYIKSLSKSITTFKFDKRGNIFIDNTKNLIGDVSFIFCDQEIKDISGVEVKLNSIGNIEIKRGAECT